MIPLAPGVYNSWSLAVDGELLLGEREERVLVGLHGIRRLARRGARHDPLAVDDLAGLGIAGAVLQPHALRSLLARDRDLAQARALHALHEDLEVLVVQRLLHGSMAPVGFGSGDCSRMAGCMLPSDLLAAVNARRADAERLL